MAGTSAGTLTIKKAVARVAVVDLSEATRSVLTECFRQFGIQTVSFAGDAAQRLQKEKFEAMVVRLDERAAAILEAARNSPSNRRIVIYGVVAAPGQVLRFSKYGINAVLDEPLERQATLRAVRSTHLLVVHELRRYVRIPIISEVTLHADSRRLKAQSVEISGGGMSLQVRVNLQMGQTVEVAFDLPGKAAIRSNAVVCWIREGAGLAGLRFDSEDQRRLRVREWIDEYLDIS